MVYHPVHVQPLEPGTTVHGLKLRLDLQAVWACFTAYSWLVKLQGDKLRKLHLNISSSPLLPL